jgi:hypothetical protein
LAGGLRFKGKVLVADWKPWVRKYWEYTTNIGFGRVGHPDHDVDDHEDWHVRQYEDMALRGFIVGLAAWPASSWWVGLLIWGLLPLLILTNYLAAGLRGGKMYYDATHEVDARNRAKGDGHG